MVASLGGSLAYASQEQTLSEELSEWQKIFVQAESTAQVLRALYTYNKSRQKKVSLTFLCRRAGIPSKGYLAFVMSGKRKLNMKYWGAICQTFKLEGIHEHILKTLLQLESNDCPEARAMLTRQLQTFKQKLLESC